MRIKHIKRILINSTEFDIKWDKSSYGAEFSYFSDDNDGKSILWIGCKYPSDRELLECILHELYEIAAVEMHTRYQRHDVSDDYIFMYDHKQHHTMANMVAGWLLQFIE